ncbi:MAG: 50S ribosomal protein L4, partial [Firmicutes bacterium]|nr:50S ribosomal protein L4 [Bacillota bacterium]
HWRHGGVAFGPHPRDYSVAFPRKMRQAAIRQALSAKLGSGELIVVESFDLPMIKTRQIIDFQKRLGLDKNAMLVSAVPNENLKMSARNVSTLRTTTSQSLSVYELLKYSRVVLDQAAVRAVEEVFGS